MGVIAATLRLQRFARCDAHVVHLRLRLMVVLPVELLIIPIIVALHHRPLSIAVGGVASITAAARHDSGT